MKGGLESHMVTSGGTWDRYHNMAHRLAEPLHAHPKIACDLGMGQVECSMGQLGMYLSIMAGCQQMLGGCCQSSWRRRILHQLLCLRTFTQACSSRRHPAAMVTVLWQHVQQGHH